MVDTVLSRHKNKLISAVNTLPNSHLLEIGVGTGKYLKQYHHKHITGIDISQKMLESARKNNSSNIDFIVLDAIQIEKLNKTFNTIVISHVLSTSTNPNEIINVAIKQLKPKGRIIIMNHFSQNKLISIFEKTFQPIAKLFHFESYFPLEKLTALKSLKLMKASKFGLLNSYQLLVFEKTK